MKKADRRIAICAELVRLMGEERKCLGLSKNKVAELTGLNQSTVSRLENYHENPTVDSLLRVADALELNLGDILKKAIKNVDSKKPLENPASPQGGQQLRPVRIKQ